MEIEWISVNTVEKIHRMVLAQSGGLPGIRDPGLLDSALARPQQLYSYEDCRDLFRLAAAYAEGISRNHAFLDGNKRTAFMTSGFFLEKNGHELRPVKGTEHADIMEKLAQGHTSGEVLAEHLRSYSQP
jgi:death on curing protein